MQGLKLRRDLAVVPVTALSFYTTAAGKTYLLAGEDNLLNVYLPDPEFTGSGSSTTQLSSSGTTLQCTIRIFKAQSIHSFHVTTTQDSSLFTPRFSPDGHFLIWGGQDVAALSLSTLDAAIASGVMEPEHCVYPTASVPDWIYDSIISPFDPTRGVLVLAHNEILPFTISPDGQLNLGHVFSIFRPILYSANICWTDPDSVLVAAGTVFGEVLIWRFNYTFSAAAVPSGDLLHVFTGHEGSIFGVQISETFKSPTGPRRFLASCSDDRTIRIWDISPTTANGSSSISELHAARETGFGDNLKGAEAAEETVETKAAPLGMAMGHLSRIWHVKFSASFLRADEEGFVLPVYSFGEDATVQRWLFESPWNPADKKTRQLRHIGSYANHDGKHLWSTALWSQDAMLRIATGGADGKISIIEAEVPSESADKDAGNHMDVIVLQDDPSISNSKSNKKDGDTMRQYAFITDDCLVATTKSGKFIAGNFGSEAAWAEVEASDETKSDLKTCTTITRTGSGKAVLGTSRGHVYGYSQETGLRKLASLGGKIMQLIALVTPDNKDAETVQVLFTIFNSSETRIVTMDFAAGSITNEAILKGVDVRFIVTAASRVGKFLVIGSRKGYLNVLSADNDEYHFLLEIPPRAHDAVTSIAAIPGHASSPTPCFLTIGRDGKYRIYRTTPSSSSSQPPVTELYHEVSLPFGPVVSAVWFASSELIICGFRSTRLIVWNESRREQIASIDCGGPHRVFSHTSPSSPLAIRVAFTKASRVYVHSQSHPAVHSLKKGIHGREIRTVAATAGGKYLASGSEDTTIRIWEAIPGRELRPAAQLNTHVSGLRSLKWAAGDWLFSSSGNEEFFVWRIRELGAGMDGIAAMFVGLLPEKSKDRDLRIMDFDVHVVSQDPENTVFRIQMAYSNSEIKTYRYSHRSGWKLLAKSQFTGACLLHIKELKGYGSPALPPVITASTDGHICIWEAQKPGDSDEIVEYKMVLATTAHQNSPKAFDISYFEAEVSYGYLIATGGDDNAIALVRYTATQPSSPSSYIVTGKWVVRGAHAAAINGLAIAQAEKATADERLFVSASNDQRVKLWRATGVVSGKVGIQILDNQYSGVSDAGSVEAVDGGFVVSGIGMEMWRMV